MPGNGLARAVDREDRSGVAGLDDVPEDGASDRPLARGRADHGDRVRLEHGPQRRPDRGVVAKVHCLEVALVEPDREVDPDLPAVVAAGDLEPRVLEDPQHRPVLGQHLGDEALDPDLARLVRDLLEQPCGDPVRLAVVGHDERDLRQPRVAEADEARQADHPGALVGADGGGEEHALARPVRVEEARDHRIVDAPGGVEPQTHARRRELRQEPPHGVGVVVGRRAQAERAPASQDDVVNALPGGAHQDLP